MAVHLLSGQGPTGPSGYMPHAHRCSPPPTAHSMWVDVPLHCTWHPVSSLPAHAQAPLLYQLPNITGSLGTVGCTEMLHSALSCGLGLNQAANPGGERGSPEPLADEGKGSGGQVGAWGLPVGQS